MKSSAEIRNTFLQFFADRGHTIVPSSPLVPINDRTLLFTNAGMVQFKEIFLGLESSAYSKAASSQRCVRAGGKHNDLENVGYTARHHTFFEMLGNFSFGDYFKREAIQYAWEFLTQVIDLPVEKLWITVYAKDDEAADIWLNEIGVNADRLSRIDGHDNFWSMGETGPCGPCSEIFYDHGPTIPGGPPGSADQDGDRYVEIWNLVFMQYNRSADGKLTELPKPSVDTGMGLERLAAVLQGVHSNYDIDVFQGLIKDAAKVTGCEDLKHTSLKVIADHIRACAFLIVDGVGPSNEGRGYVLRRVIRRAALHGYELGVKEPFFYKMVAALIQQMGDAYPELIEQQKRITNSLRQEEERFAETLAQGMKILNEEIEQLTGKVIPGETVFKLYDTYGFPGDLTADIASTYKLSIDQTGFDRLMEQQKRKSREAGKFSEGYSTSLDVHAESEFNGYERLSQTAIVTDLFADAVAINRLEQGKKGIVVLDQSVFYAESGGQVGDRGVILGPQSEFAVEDTQKQGSTILHIGSLIKGELKKGDKIVVEVDPDRRKKIMIHHSATHLLHAALRNVLGDHVTQKGSLVDAEKLRFDFSHTEPVSKEHIMAVETQVNDQIRQNHDTGVQLMSMDEAKKSGAMALFGEKYGDTVRVVGMGNFSVELCGGTHVQRTGDIGLMKIMSETGVAAGIRRIEAVAGSVALEWISQNEALLDQLSNLVKSGRNLALEKVQVLIDQNRSMEKELEQIKAKMASTQGQDLAQQAVEIQGLKVLAASLDGADPKSLRNTVDQLKNSLGSAAVILGTVSNGKVSLVAGVTKDVVGRINAVDLVNCVALRVGGKGGGRPDMAQAGGNDPKQLKSALQTVQQWVKEQLSQ